MNSEWIIALHALAYLDHVKTRNVSSEELAESICTNPARIRKVMAKLKKAALVQTKEGNNGGYVLHKRAQDITLASINEALQCDVVKTGWKSGTLNTTCMIATGMGTVCDELKEALNQACVAYLQTLTIADIGAQLIALKKQDN